MSDDRLDRAMAVATPPRDPSFTLAVLRAAENARYKRDRLRRMLIGAGLAVDAGLLLLLVSYAINSNPSDTLTGVGAVASCGALLLTMRSATRLVSARS